MSAFADTGAERAILAAIISEPETYWEVSHLTPEHFTSESRALLWSVLANIMQAGLTPDLPVIYRKLEEAGEDSGEAINMVSEALGGLWDAHNVPAYGKALVDARTRLRAHSVALRLCQLSQDPHRSIREAIAEATEALALSDEESAKDSGHASHYYDQIVAAAEQMAAGGVPEGCISTGYHHLDRILGLLSPGQLIVIAARPGVGKTALAGNILHDVTGRQGHGALMISLEMDGQSVMAREVSAQTRIQLQRLEHGPIFDTDLEKLGRIRDSVKSSKLWICHQASMEIPDIRAKILRHRATSDLQLVVVDYLQLIRHSRSRTRYEGVSQVVRDLKAIAMEQRIPLIALAQLSRAAEQSEVPLLSHLKESGEIEQTADKVILLEREIGGREATFWVAKNRQGPVGSVVMEYTPETTRFTEQEPEDHWH